MSRLVQLAMLMGASSSRSADFGHWRNNATAQLRSFFLQLCGELAVQTLIEAGAHRAEISVDFMNRIKGQAIAFEANPHVYSELTMEAAQHGVDVRNMGVTRTSGKLELHIPLWAGDKSYLTPGNSSFLKRTDDIGYETVTVDSSSLDDIYGTLPAGRGLALWLDLEGYAGDALLGAAGVLKSGSLKVVMVEVETLQHWLEQKTDLEIDDLLADFDYIPVMRDMEGDSQYNIIYVHQSVAAKAERLVIEYWRQISLYAGPA